MDIRSLKLVTFVVVLVVTPLVATAALADEPVPGAAAQEGKGPGDQSGPRCKDNGDCDRNQFCHRRAGKCNGPGRCAVRPQACTEIYDPVCGCDGKTYSNTCFAHTVGVNIKAAGPCEKACTTNRSCSRDEYCAKATGDCGGSGLCEQRPEVCTQIYDPVCGCDGEVYSNACTAASAGSSVASLGDVCK